ncbi:MAG: PhzF family phenazine biosynthesis protein [Thermoplasmata archaeon]
MPEKLGDPDSTYRSARRLAFATVDVFTTRPLEGNSLAVLPDVTGLTEGEMLAIAREFHLSETTFVFRREAAVERVRGIRTRIFTTGEEMPFAGHPTLGTAAVLRARGAGDEVNLELNVGTIPVRFSQRGGRAFGEMTQIDPVFGRVHDRDRVAEAIGVTSDEIEIEPPIQTVSTGNPVAIVPFARLETLQRWSPSWERMESYLRGSDARFVYAVCRETVDSDAQLHARMVFYGGDDPATGSAAGPAAAWMVRWDLVPSGSTVQIEQGLEVHRPSRIFARAERAGERVTQVRVGGFFAPMTEGELTLPGVA